MKKATESDFDYNWQPPSLDFDSKKLEKYKRWLEAIALKVKMR